jgi:hypothetical protein
VPISLTNFTNGTTMTAATMRANFDAIRTYMNGNIPTTDIDDASIQTRHIKKMESFGSPNRRTTGVSGTIWHRYNTDHLAERSRHTWSMGGERWHESWGNFATIYVPFASTLEISASYWAWFVAPNNGLTNPEQYNGGDVALSMDQSIYEETRRTIFDAGNAVTIAGGGDGGGPILYSARQATVFTMQSVSAGYHDIALNVKVASHVGNEARYGQLFIGARILVVEYYRL